MVGTRLEIYLEVEKHFYMYNMKVVQKNENSGNITSSNVTVKDNFLNRGTSDFKGRTVFNGEVVFKNNVHGLSDVLYSNTCPTSKFPPPLASTFGPSFVAPKDGIYKFYVEIAFTQNPNSEVSAFLTADFYINGKAMHDRTPESCEKFILHRTIILKKADRVELRICEDFFSGITYVLDPASSYYEIVSL